MKKVLLFIFPCLLLLACNTTTISPKSFQKQTEDFVRFKIALINVMIQDYNDLNKHGLLEDYLSELTTTLTGESLFDIKWNEYLDSLTSFQNEIEALRNGDEMNAFVLAYPEGDLYRYVLHTMSSTKTNKYHDYAEKVLKEYDKTLVLLSDYSEVETSSNYKIWNFKEINTELAFQTIINIDDKSYNCVPDKTSINRYFNRNTK